MNSVELILAIKEYAKRQGVDFEIALKMLGMMYEDGVHLDGGYEDLIPRHHKGLIEVIELLGDKANGFCAKLKVTTISTPMYRVDEYGGNESVETPDSYNWVIINE